GDACTRTDICKAEVCQGTNPVVCSASDQCHAPGACDPATGNCSNPNATDWTACNDRNACTTNDTCSGGSCVGGPALDCNDGNTCTQTDTCQGGLCTGSDPVDCPTPDQCHDTNVCNPATGICSNPPLTGIPCDDTNPCTLDDTCQVGVCAGTPKVCDDGQYCNGQEACS